MGEEEGGVAVVGFAPGAVVPVLGVAGAALALERSLLVGAHLRADSSHLTLVHICIIQIKNNYNNTSDLKLFGSYRFQQPPFHPWKREKK